MSGIAKVEARWIEDDEVWIATSVDIPGLVIEGATWSDMVRETRLVLPDLCEVSGFEEPAEIIFQAEERLTLATA